MFGAPQQQQQPVDPSAAFYDSILNCQVFGDERDDTLRRWNLLQALYGFGKGEAHGCILLTGLEPQGKVKPHLCSTSDYQIFFFFFNMLSVRCVFSNYLS